MYYTPVIEEFYVGFKYEYKLNSGEWVSTIFEPNDIGFTHRYKEESFFIEEGGVRVRCLERKDIEDCGFTNLGSGWFFKEDCLTVSGKNGLNCKVRK